MCAKRESQQSRRRFLVQALSWVSGITALVLSYPLFRFVGFTIKPKPRYITVRAPLPASGFHAERDFILFITNSSPQAISRICTHLGCRVNFLEDKQIIECPCHQSRFKKDGTLISGPAKKDLPRFTVEPRTNESGQITSYVVTL